MTHAEMNELYDLYALGVLEPELAAEIDKHLEERCEYCMENVRGASNVIAALGGTVQSVAPPRRLRERVLASVRPPKRSNRWTFAVAALSAACAVLVLTSIWSTTRMVSLRDQLSGMQRERNELRAAVELLSKSDTRTVQFGRAENTPHGRVLVNRSGGIVFVGSQLPPLPRDKTFELWLIPASGAPQPAGLFRPNAAGDSVNVSSLAVSPESKAVAVTIEPSAGSNAPTTTPFLVVPLA
jgi:anti-sigma-K factor RskA